MGQKVPYRNKKNFKWPFSAPPFAFLLLFCPSSHSWLSFIFFVSSFDSAYFLCSTEGFFCHYCKSQSHCFEHKTLKKDRAQYLNHKNALKNKKYEQSKQFYSWNREIRVVKTVLTREKFSLLSVQHRAGQCHNCATKASQWQTWIWRLMHTPDPVYKLIWRKSDQLIFLFANILIKIFFLHIILGLKGIFLV